MSNHPYLKQLLWLDTRGLHRGGMFIRWQQLTRPVENPDNVAIRKVKLVKLADLRTELPADMAYVTAAQRKKLLGERERSYKLRCGGTPCEVSNPLGIAGWE